MHLTTEQTAIKKELGIIMELAYEKTMTTESDVFVDYMAHTNELTVTILGKGWHNTPEDEEGLRPYDYRAEFYLEGPLAPENVPAELARVIRKLQEL